MDVEWVGQCLASDDFDITLSFFERHLLLSDGTEGRDQVSNSCGSLYMAVCTFKVTGPTLLSTRCWG